MKCPCNWFGTPIKQPLGLEGEGDEDQGSENIQLCVQFFNLLNGCLRLRKQGPVL